MKKFIERIPYINKLMSYQDKDIIKVVTGLRRSGKSTLLSLLRNRLLENDVMVTLNIIRYRGQSQTQKQKDENLHP